ncbi:MAG: AarF/ABC1/UbiB kinase family protein, partial [bacterium]|nr:AarF/ABC1/UbiB kinase family protein [bacterium]
FLDFSDDPIGSASIAHVYKAKLRDGASVAVKIQRPDAEEIFESDFLIIIFLAQIFDFFKSTSFISAVEVAHDFIRWTRHELDFRNEAGNGDAFYKYSEGGYNAIIPKQYLNLTTKRVLVEDFMEGGILASKIINSEVSEKALDRMSVSRDILAGNIMFEMMRQYFADGFFHADAHPSSIMVLPENKIAFMGFGIVGEAGINRFNLLKFLRAISISNMEEATASMIDFGESSYQEEIELFIISARDKRGSAKKLFEKIKKVIIKDFSVKAEAILKPWVEAAGNKELSVAERSSSSVFFRLLWEA